MEEALAAAGQADTKVTEARDLLAEARTGLAKLFAQKAAKDTEEPKPATEEELEEGFAKLEKASEGQGSLTPEAAKALLGKLKAAKPAKAAGGGEQADVQMAEAGSTAAVGSGTIPSPKPAEGRKLEGQDLERLEGESRKVLAEMGDDGRSALATLLRQFDPRNEQAELRSSFCKLVATSRGSYGDTQRDRVSP